MQDLESDSLGDTTTTNTCELKCLAKNVQSIKSDLREIELFECLVDLSWDILLLNETWRTEREEIWKTAQGHLFLGSGWKNGQGGVAIMSHSKQTRGFKSFQAVSERVCAADVDIFGNKLRFISTYMPDSSYDDAEVESTYLQLDRLCDKAKMLRRHIIMGGDMNAIAGKCTPGEEKVVGPHVEGESNVRGEWLKSWAGLNEIAITNTFFNQNLSEQWSYKNGDDRKLLDYILTDQTFLEKFKKAEIQDIISVGADHRTVTTTITLTRPCRKHSRKSKTNRIGKGWKPKDDVEYKRMVAERLHEVRADSGVDWLQQCAEDKCRKIEAILDESSRLQASTTMAASIPDDKITLRRLIESRKQARRAGDRPGERETSKRIQKELKAMGRARRTAKVENILADFRDLKRLEKTRTRQTTQLIGSVKAADGSIQYDRDGIANAFAEFYKLLYADANKILFDISHLQSQGGNIEDIKTGEVEAQLKTMGRGKGADDDGIFAEIVKHGGPEIADELAAIFNDVLKGKEQIPAYWKRSKISVLFKKGDRQEPENYRPLCITPILHRLFSKVLLNRIHTKLESAQSRDQAGFRATYGCVDHIFALTSIVERATEFGIPLWIAAIDFQKAFDSVSHAAVWEALAEQGVEKEYIEMLQRLYDGQEATVQTDTRSSSFQIHRGVKQGDPISAILFNAVVEMFMTKTKARWARQKYGMKVDSFSADDYLTNLRYADDILIVARSLPQIKQMLADIETEAGRVGLRLHPGKTKILHNGIGYGTNARTAKCGTMNIEILDKDGHATYLGRAVRLTAMEDEEIKSRIAKAWAKYGVFRQELNDQHVPVKLRMKLFEAVISPTILYGCEAWAMKQKSQLKLRSTQRKMMRLLTRAHKTYDNYDNYADWIKDATAAAEAVRTQHSVKSWTEAQCSKKWEWAGKVAQSHEGRWTVTSTTWKPYQTRPRGRPKHRWHDSINNFLTLHSGVDHKEDDWMKEAKDPIIWSRLKTAYLIYADLKQ